MTTNSANPVAPKSAPLNETRDAHLAWCKRRALEYVDAGDLSQAYASMVSDLRKHPDTENHAGIELGMLLLMSGHLSTAFDMRHFIDGFN